MLFGNVFWRHLMWYYMCRMGENPKSGLFLQKALEILVYAIYIQCRNPFCICYLISLSMGYERGELGHPRGEYYLNLGRSA